MFDLKEPTPLLKLEHEIFSKKNIEVLIKRDDQIDDEISGNKWRKLKYNLIHAGSLGFKKILTFGGAYSNHISATAAACARYGFDAVGIIRGDELNKNSNATLQFAHSKGMELQFVDRNQYRERTDSSWLQKLQNQHQAYVIPEGGTNKFAIKGVAEILNEIDIDFDFIVCPVGTGGTLAGLASALDNRQSAIGISCLKGAEYLEQEIQSLLGSNRNWRINHDYQFGGYAKFDSRLMEFINEFRAHTGIPLDPVYTGKMIFAVMDMINKDKFAKGSRIICLHTGGLQGIAGFNQKNKNLLKT